MIKSFHQLEPGDVVLAHGARLKVKSVQLNQPGNIPSVPRTVVTWQELIAPGCQAVTYRGEWTSGLSSDITDARANYHVED